MVPGQNKPQTLNYDKCKKVTYMYIMYFPALLPVLENLETLPVYRGHVRQIL